ncbi:uncharacterized protein B0H18DRAFT_1050071 [Fomitopsis serialis]|uniref:uncharacterized protein n=1 Tax=Fomitopsis serialis TaxID=139415 RepID=UPI002007F732|nr:uncharacterized protein B0H18DRAFT_1050071 [Neoantrodia serialis]KAH9913261.1 hypothetical protein B0H18DRAFT_1050071 [Neoantrodia serialis]
MPQPLPTNNYVFQPWQDAYAKCLHHEQVGNTIGDATAAALVRARILGYAMLETPSDTGRDCLSREINSCGDDDEFERLATLYINHFLRCFRAAKGRTRSPSTHPSRPSFDATQETLQYPLEEAPQNHATAKQKALIRDGYRCMLTGAFDIVSVKEKPHILPADAPVTFTQAAHIFPESTNIGISGINQNGARHEYAATVWTVMARFGDTFVFDELNGPNVHRLENVMTLRGDEHTHFEMLNLWLESTDTPHTYTPQTTHPMYRRNIPTTVTFTTPDPEKLPLPSPDYLRLHAAAARYINKILRDMEKTRVLSNDGSSALLLTAALEGISVHG